MRDNLKRKEEIENVLRCELDMDMRWKEEFARYAKTIAEICGVLYGMQDAEGGDPERKKQLKRPDAEL